MPVNISTIKKFEYEGDEYYFYNDVLEVSHKMRKGIYKASDFESRYNLKMVRFRDNSIELIKSKTILDPEDIYAIPAKWIENNVDEVRNKLSYLEAPPILELCENEKIRSRTGREIRIEVRGTRGANDCIFRVKDIEIGFHKTRLQSIILAEGNNYTRGVDYEIYNVRVTSEKDGKIKLVPTLFLKYVGLLRVLFTTKNGKTTGFISWATHVLFTAHLGTMAGRMQLAAKIIEANPENVIEVLDKCAIAISCFYIYECAFVEDVAESLGLIDCPFDWKIFKYGYTNSLSRRTDEHSLKYGKYNGIELRLKYFYFVDPSMTSDVEKEFREKIRPLGYRAKNTEGYRELLCLDDNAYDEVEKIATEVCGKYSKTVKDLNEIFSLQKMENLRLQGEITALKKDVKIAKEQTKVAQRCAKKDAEMAKKDARLAEFELKEQKRQNRKLAKLLEKKREICEEYQSELEALKKKLAQQKKETESSRKPQSNRKPRAKTRY